MKKFFCFIVGLIITLGIFLPLMHDSQPDEKVHVHHYRREVVEEPSCVTPGLIVSTCDECGKVVKITPGYEQHKYSEWEEVSRTEKKITKVATCKVCGKVKKQEFSISKRYTNRAVIPCVFILVAFGAVTRALCKE